ncbi:MAG: trypsin-like peptidase domain-containing protein [Clostridia bacterium]|nr:trypsin-like peptidase domain-containing protein [Clostridia bacterium]
MSDLNDYRWYNDDFQNNQQPVAYTAPQKKKRSRKGWYIALVCVMAAIMLASTTVTVFVLASGDRSQTHSNSLFQGDVNSSFNYQQLTDGERESKSTVEIAAQVGPSVVGITTKYTYRSFFGQSYEQSGSGSGIIISDDGYIATNFHVIENANAVSVTLNTGEEFGATVVGYDAETDLALLKISASGLAEATLGTSDALQVGELAVAIGNPLGQELAGTVTVGVISAVNRSIASDNGKTMTLIQTDAAINPGNSGGALVNAYGEVIGINSMKFSGSGVEGIGFAIPMDIAKPILTELMTNGYVTGRPLIGISLREITPEIAAINDIPAGVQVAYVSEGGAAEKAGIKQGDTIVSVDGKLVETTKDVSDIRDQHKAGDTIKIVVNRDGQTLSFDVVLQEDTTSRTSN